MGVPFPAPVFLSKQFVLSVIQMHNKDWMIGSLIRHDLQSLMQQGPAPLHRSPRSLSPRSVRITRQPYFHTQGLPCM